MPSFVVSVQVFWSCVDEDLVGSLCLLDDQQKAFWHLWRGFWLSPRERRRHGRRLGGTPCEGVSENDFHTVNKIEGIDPIWLVVVLLLLYAVGFSLCGQLCWFALPCFACSLFGVDVCFKTLQLSFPWWSAHRYLNRSDYIFDVLIIAMDAWQRIIGSVEYNTHHHTVSNCLYMGRSEHDRLLPIMGRGMAGCVGWDHHQSYHTVAFFLARPKTQHSWNIKHSK